MNINIVCVGKIKEKYFNEAIAEFEKRLGRFCNFKITELPDKKIPDNPTPGQEREVLEAEGAEILRAIGKGDYVIALCVEGKPLSSEEWAAKTAEVMQTRSAITYVIGGSLGLSPAVKERADLHLHALADGLAVGYGRRLEGYARAELVLQLGRDDL